MELIRGYGELALRGDASALDVDELRGEGAPLLVFAIEAGQRVSRA